MQATSFARGDYAANAGSQDFNGVLVLLLAYTHYYGLFTLASQGIFVFFFLWRRAGWSLPGLLRQDTFRHAGLTACLVALA